MPIVHGVGLSPFVRKVRVALAEKGLAYDHNPVMPMAAPEGYEKLHPLKKVPVYQDGDLVLPDSTAILAYLERAHPETPLVPSDAGEYGRALWYEEYGDTRLIETIGPIFFNRVVSKFMGQQPDEAVVAEKLAALPELFTYLEGELSDGREYLAGGRFSVADIGIGTCFVNLQHAGESVDAGRFPKLAAYVERVLSRPSFKGLIEEERAMIPS